MKSTSGQLFLVGAIMLLMIIAVLMFGAKLPSFSKSQEAESVRVRTIDNFVSSFKQDAERAAGIAGFRTFLALEEFMSQTGEFLNDTEPLFIEAFQNGTVMGNEYDVMKDSDFGEYIGRVDLIASQISLEFDAQTQETRLYHLDPFTVVVEVDLLVIVLDQKNVANWTFNHTVTSTVPLVDLKDPLYIQGTLGKLVVTIQPTNITLFVNDTVNQNDTTNLQIFLNESQYRPSTSAPSYLMRFEGDFGNSTFGIESLVNLKILDDQGVAVGDNELSVVDYIYFGNATPQTACNIQNMEFTPEWFILDSDHLDDYDVEGNLEYDEPC